MAKPKKPPPVPYLDRMLFEGPIRYSLCITEEQYTAEMERLRVPVRPLPPWVSSGAGATVHHLEDSDGELVAIVCLDPSKYKTGPCLASSLVHEAVHIWQETKRYIGELNPSDEFEAYAIQFLSWRLMQSYADQTS